MFRCRLWVMRVGIRCASIQREVSIERGIRVPWVDRSERGLTLLESKSIVSDCWIGFQRN
jgi:hypothetical protein